MTGRFTIRHLLLLLAVVAAGWGVGQLVRRALPIGRDLSGDPALAAVFADRSSPREAPSGADLTMTVFTDYRCPACRVAAPAMEQAVRADGRVTVVYRDWPIFGVPSIAAARVALAAAPQGIYPALHHRLMAERQSLTMPVLLAAVATVGGDPAMVEAELARNGAAIDAQLAANARAARALKLPGTPAYLIGPVLVVGAIDAGEFARAFARARRINR